MKQLSNDDVADRIEGLVHRPTQEATDGIDVTIDRVYALQSPGAIDFGGDEQRDADRRALEAEKHDPNDDYGWWSLDEGVYVFEFNESLQLNSDELAVVTPLPRLTHAGANHSELRLAPDDLDDRPFETVAHVCCGSGIEIKENARASRLRVYDLK